MADDIKRVEIRPVSCLQEGWELVRPRYWLFVGICTVAVLLGSMAPMAMFTPKLLVRRVPRLALMGVASRTIAATVRGISACCQKRPNSAPAGWSLISR